MARDSFKVKKSLNIEPSSSAGASPSAGDLRVDSNDNNSLKLHDGTDEHKLLSSGSVTNEDIEATAAISYSKLDLADSIVDADIATNAAVDATKIADGSVSNTEFQYISELTSDAQAQIDSKITAPSSTDNTVARYDGTSGAVQDSAVVIDDSNNVSGIENLTATGTTQLLGTSNSDTAISIGTGTGTNTINIGGANSTVNITGTVNNQNVTNLNVEDKLITLNDGGAASSGAVAGIEIEEDGTATAYVKTSADRNAWEVKAPNTAGVVSVKPASTDDEVALLAKTQTLTNKTLTSPVINTSVFGTAILDEDDFASNSDTKLATQQSIKAYVDTQILAADGGSILSVRSVTTTDSCNSSDDVLLLSGSSFTETLFTAVGNTGKVLYIKHAGTSLTQVYTLNTTSSQTIGGVASGSYALYTNGETLVIVSDGSNWQIIDHKTNSGVSTSSSSSLCTWTTNVSSVSCEWDRDGMFANLMWKVTLSGAPDNVQLGFKLPPNMSAANYLLSQRGNWQSQCVDSSASAAYFISGTFITDTLLMGLISNTSSLGVGCTRTVPFTTATGDQYWAAARIPISGWQP